MKNVRSFLLLAKNRFMVVIDADVHRSGRPGRLNRLLEIASGKETNDFDFEWHF